MAISAEELARALGGTLAGSGGIELHGAASLEEAGPADLGFVESARWAARGAASRAGCLLLAGDTLLGGRTTITLESPRLAFARALELLYPAAQPLCGVHATAVVDPSAVIHPEATIGAHVTVGASAVVGARAVIGPGCVLGEDTEVGAATRLVARVVLYPGTRLGARVLVHAGAVLGSDGFGFVRGRGSELVKFPQVGRLEIEDDVEIGANTTIDRGALGRTRIGAGTKIDNLVQVAHNVEIGRDVAISAQVGIAGSSTIGDGATIAGQVGVGDHVRIEGEAIVAAQAGVASGKIVRRGQIVWGTPARPLDDFKRQYAQLSRVGEMREQLRSLARRLDGLDGGGAEPERASLQDREREPGAPAESD